VTKGRVQVVGGGGGMKGVVERQVVGLGKGEEGSDSSWLLENSIGRKRVRGLRRQEEKGRKRGGRRGRAHRNVLLLAWSRAEPAFHLQWGPYHDGSVEERSCGL